MDALKAANKPSLISNMLSLISNKLKSAKDSPDLKSVVTNAIESLNPAEGTRSWLLPAFAAPLGPLAPAMTELFDGVSQTLRWSQ